MNAWEQVAWIASESLNHLEDSLVLTQLTAKDKTADFNVKPNGYSVGSTVEIKTNPVYEADEFTTTTSIQGIRSSARSLTIEKHFDVSVEMTAREKRLDMTGFAEEVIKPAVYALAEKADNYVGTKILNARGLYTSASIYGTAADMALAKKAATFQQLSKTGRFCIVDDTLEAALLGATYFNTHNNRGESGERVFNDAALGRAMGMEFFSSLNFPEDTHVNGTGAGVTDNTVATDNLVGNTVIKTDATTNQFEIGDRIQIAGVRRPYIVSAQTVATSTSIPISHPITEIIPDGAAITVVSSGATYDVRGAIFDDKSIAVAMPMLDTASDKPSFVASFNGYSVRVVQGYDMITKKEMMSLDMLVGAEAYDQRRITLIGDNQ
jgi:hypothetical protein